MEKADTVVIPGIGVLGAFGGAAVAARSSGLPFLPKRLGVGWDARAERVSLKHFGRGMPNVGGSVA